MAHLPVGGDSGSQFLESVGITGLKTEAHQEKGTEQVRWGEGKGQHRPGWSGFEERARLSESDC